MFRLGSAQQQNQQQQQNNTTMTNLSKFLLNVIFGTLFLAGWQSISVFSAEDVCVDVGPGQFACTDDVLATRDRIDGYTINVGVTQRIDGNDAEKKAIRDILRRMDDYFFKEVLALPEYESVRPQW